MRSLWILMSDRLLGLLNIEREAVTRISIAKGWWKTGKSLKKVNGSWNTRHIMIR
ncbi:MAG TPA: hypothetical protein VEG39_07585 [Clostridia bacterium]|nr:hypothetical protein [Clostridia bacterium]